MYYTEDIFGNDIYARVCKAKHEFVFYPVSVIHLTLPELNLPLILCYRNCINKISKSKICVTLKEKGRGCLHFKDTFQLPGRETQKQIKNQIVKLNYLLIYIWSKKKLIGREIGLNSMVKALLSSRNTNRN